MEKVKLAFAKGRHPYSYMIRMRYQSRWSHVVIVAGDKVQEALNPEGVVYTPLDEFVARYGDDRIAFAEAWAKPGWRERMDEMDGLKYDFWGAFGMGIGTRRFDHPDKVWCSHHVGYVLGTPRKDRMLRLSPEHIWIYTD